MAALTDMNMVPVETVKADFDRIALLATEEWSQNIHYHEYLLQYVPARVEAALEIGSGTGQFARRLAGVSKHVTAIDLSSEMLRVAREQSRAFSNIDFMLADVMAWKFPQNHFDCISSIATLHHLPAAVMFEKMKAALKPGGTLLILDLVQGEGWGDRLLDFVALPFNVSMRFFRTGRLRAGREVREAWKEHESHDRYLTYEQLTRLCAEILPGAKLTKHLLWRYSIIWQKP